MPACQENEGLLMGKQHRAKGDTRTTKQRGYGIQHQKLRAQWKRVVEAGQAQCHATTCLMQSRAIMPTEPWDLGHDPHRNWTGPEHRRCNRADGARRKNNPTPPPPRRSREL